MMMSASSWLSSSSTGFPMITSWSFSMSSSESRS